MVKYARRQLQSSAGKMGSITRQINSLEELGEKEQELAEKRGYTVQDRRFVDKNGDPIKFATTEEAIKAKIAELKERQAGLRPDLEAKKEGYAQVKAGEHPGMQWVNEAEEQAQRNIAAIHEGQPRKIEVKEESEASTESAREEAPLEPSFEASQEEAPQETIQAAGEFPLTEPAAAQAEEFQPVFDLEEEGLAAFEEERAPEHLEDLLEEAEQQATEPGQQEELAEFQEVQESEDQVLAQDQAERRLGFIERIREKWRNFNQNHPKLKRNVAVGAATLALIAGLATYVGEMGKALEGGFGKSIPYVAPQTMPEKAQAAPHYEVGQRPSIHNADQGLRERAPVNEQAPDTFMGQPMSYWEGMIPGNYDRAEVLELFKNPSARQDLETRVRTYQQDKQNNSAQTFDKGETNPAKAAFHEWLGSWLSNR